MFGALSRAISGFFGGRGGPGGASFMPMLEIDVARFWPQMKATVTESDKIAVSFLSFEAPLRLAVNSVIIPSIRANFEAEGRPKWQSLSDSRVAGRKGQAHPILNDTGKLKSVATSPSIWRYTPYSAEVTGMDSVSYAGYVQGGTTKMPAREFLTIQPEDAAKIERLFAEWVDVQTRGWS